MAIRKISMHEESPRHRGLKDIPFFFEGVPLNEIINTNSLILEVGCGYGNTSRDFISKYGGKVISLDLYTFEDITKKIKMEYDLRDKSYISYVHDENGFISRVKHRILSTIGLRNKFISIRGDMEKLPFRDDCFDFLFGFRSVQYTSDLLSNLKEFYRVLKEGAMAVIDVTNIGPYKDLWSSEIQKIILDNPEFKLDKDYSKNIDCGYEWLENRIIIKK